MYAKILAPLLSGAVLAFLDASSASAEEAPACSTTLELGFSQGHIDPNYGVDTAPGVAVAEGLAGLTCDHFTVQLKSVMELSSDDHDRNPGIANEQRIGLGYAHDVHTPVGTLKLDATLDYRALNLGKGLDVTRDDYIEGAVGLALPITRGRWTVTPSLRLIKDVPVGNNNNLNFKQGALRLDGPFLGTSTFYIDVKDIRNENSTTAVLHKNVWFGEAGVTRHFDTGWTGTMGVAFSQYGKQDSRFIHRIERGGRLTPYRMAGPAPEHAGFNAFLRFTYVH